MKKQIRLLLVFIIACMLCACGAPVAEVPETVAETAAATEPKETEPAATEPQIAEAVMPETDAATGTMLFYFDDHAVHAGGPMSDLINVGIQTDQDLERMVQPGHTSEVIAARVDLEENEAEDDPLLFVVAVNAGTEAAPVSACMIYSITVNTESGIRFGSGNETEPFVSGETTKEQIVAAYGEPGYSRSGNSRYVEIAYCQNFNSVYFTFESGVVRQIVSCYSANMFGDLAGSLDYDLSGIYFGGDCAVLLNRYLNVIPYLDGTAEAQALESLEESIVMDGQTIELGVQVVDMPDPFGEPFEDLLMPLSYHYYVRTGIGNEEEFYVYNLNGQNGNYADRLVVKGVITENCNYTNWGIDNSGFHSFEYMGLTNDASIEDVLETFGLPYDIQFNSTGRLCDAWLFYEDVSGNTLNIRVDPMLNQIVELRVSKHYPGENFYS